MYVIVGLGNPDRKYMHNRHNAGYLTLEVLAKRHSIELCRMGHKAVVGEGRIGGEKVALAKPVTYMNLSGQSVVELMNWYKAEFDKLIVVYDDIDLDVGMVRVREKGSAGTHNGMRSIIGLTGRDDFPRVRVGIGPKPPEWELGDFVLCNFAEQEKQKVFGSFEEAAYAVEMIIKEGVLAAKAAYSKKKKAQPIAEDDESGD